MDYSVTFFTLLCSVAVVQARIHTLHIISEIQSRFAITDVTSIMENEQKTAQEITFSVGLPASAFISNFTMDIDGKTVVGEVKEKDLAKQIYGEAKKKGWSAGHVSQNPRETNLFSISVNVRAKGQVTFILTYQEVLKRVHGAYKHIINIKPNEPVPDVQVDVLISEMGKIYKVKVPEYGEKIGDKTNKELLSLPASKHVEIQQYEENKTSLVYISYRPTTMRGSSANGQLVVLYDLKRTKSGGQIEVVNGYFLHFLALKGIPRASKHVVFVLDKSSSMTGRKFRQLKDAMEKILMALNQNDRFNLVLFSYDVKLWQVQSVPGERRNVREAISFVRQSSSGGGKLKI